MNRWYRRHHRRSPQLICLVLSTLLAACSSASPPTPAAPALAPLPTPDTPAVLLPTPEPDLPVLPEVAARQEAIRQALAADPPILPLAIPDDAANAAAARQAQQIALATPQLLQVGRVITQTADGGLVALRTEVMQVDPLRQSDLNEQLAACEPHLAQCYRVRIYNYADNMTIDTFVDLTLGAALAISTQDGARVNVPEELGHLAERIAAASPAIRAQLAEAGLMPTTRREAAQNPVQGPGNPATTASTNAAGQGPGGATLTAPLMAGTQTTLKNTSCAFRRHLCVAPTYVDPQARRALWAVVDLTLFQLVGYQWTPLGDLAEPPDGQVNEQSLRESAIAAEYCVTADDPATAIGFDQDGWSGKYALTESDGLKIWEVAYQGLPVLRSAKLVDIHVAYRAEHQFAPQGRTAIAVATANAVADPGQSGGPGYSDGVGCPSYSQSAVLAAGPPVVRPLMEGAERLGFELWQSFKSPLWPAYCNYYYVQIMRFYADGRLQIVAGNAGRGCGDFGTYRPVLRIALAPRALTWQEWDGQRWTTWQQERWQLQTDRTAYTTEGYQYRAIGADGTGWAIEPGQGQFPHNRGDRAYAFVTRYKADEGEQDLGTIGSCCRSDEKQGPEQYLNGETIAGQELVLWYVGQMQNSAHKGAEFCWADRVPTNTGLYEDHPFPCLIGPMFHPFGVSAGKAPS